jgi:AcrR family transcriptional regulator
MEDDLEGRVIDAAMKLAETRGWHHTTLGAIAASADLPLSELRRLFPSKTAILTRLAARVDTAVLAATPVWTDRDSPRDRLFDLLMRRFDALRDYRRGLGAVLGDLPWQPSTLWEVGKSFNLSMAWMWTAAGLESPGCCERVQRLGLAGLYLRSLRIWLNDQTPDLARTMAALDTGLRHAESLMSITEGWYRHQPARTAATPPDSRPGPQSVGPAPTPTTD